LRFCAQALARRTETHAESARTQAADSQRVAKLKQAGSPTDGSPTEAKASGKGSPTDARSQRDGSE